MEERLAAHLYLRDGRLTEADWQLFRPLVRSGAVDVGHFKMQHAPDRGLPQFLVIHPRPLSASRCRGDLISIELETGGLRPALFRLGRAMPTNSVASTVEAVPA